MGLHTFTMCSRWYAWIIQIKNCLYVHMYMYIYKVFHLFSLGFASKHIHTHTHTHTHTWYQKTSFARYFFFSGVRPVRLKKKWGRRDTYDIRRLLSCGIFFLSPHFFSFFLPLPRLRALGLCVCVCVFCVCVVFADACVCVPMCMCLVELSELHAGVRTQAWGLIH
jgi:hypothetical protein